ncbi:uncharacterized protein LOC125428988 isoform X2 [Sphaerodactylus townsendi]|nr:uncharacterized protein LOC125428988 isoform X2 [Sphaerodactylus townsendi]
MLKGSSLVRRRPSACLIGHILSCTWQQTPKMKRILVLVFSVLLCLAAVKSLICKSCQRYEVDKCLEGDDMCMVPYKNPRCVNIVQEDEKKMWSFCGTVSSCEDFERQKDHVPGFSLVCCDTDLCNVQPPWALLNETVQESDPTSSPENL